MSISEVLPQREELVLEPNPPAAADRSSAPVFVWGIWTALLIEVVRYVYRFGSGLPFHEDWFAVDILTGKFKLTWSSLWQQSWAGGHRSPLPLLLYFWDIQLFGLNVLPILYLNVTCFVLLSAGLIWAARHVRGTTEYADAFFPVVLFNLGHGETLLWAGTLGYVLTTFFVVSFLIIQVVSRWRPGPPAALASGLCVALLPLSNAVGCAYSLLLAFSLGYTGYRLLRSQERRERLAGGVCLGFTLLALLIVVLYFQDYKASPFDFSGRGLPPPVTPRLVVKTALKFMAMGFGPAARPPAFPLSGVYVAGLVLIAALCLARGLLLRRGPARDCATGLASYLLACLTITLAAGYTRATFEYNYLFESRYAVASVPTVLALYFIWESFGPKNLKAVGRLLLLSIALATLSRNWTIGMEDCTRSSKDKRDFTRDVRAGIPIPQIVSRYWYRIFFSSVKLEEYLKFLRDARIGDYRSLPADPPIREVKIALDPIDSRNVALSSGATGRAFGLQPYLTFKLEKPIFVYGIRIRYVTKNDAGKNAWFRVVWRDTGKQQPFPSLVWETWGPRHFLYLLGPQGKETEIPIWIYRTIDEIRVYPDKRPCEFSIAEITLLLPETDTPPVAVSEDDET